MLGAVSAAENRVVAFHAMPHDLAAAMGAWRGESVDRTLEAIERMRHAIAPHGETLVVVVSANLTDSHDPLLLLHVAENGIDDE